MSRIRVKLATAVMLAGTAVGATLATSTPASAGTAPCPAKFYCFYGDANYAGWHLNYNETTSGNFKNPPYSSGDHHDQLSSIINNGNRTICIYDNHIGNPDTLLIKVRPYQDVKNLADLNELNDKADYWKVNC